MGEGDQRHAMLAKALDNLLELAAGHGTASFRGLAEAAYLDPACDFVGASLRNIDLRDEDLRGFDFRNADLTGADFRRANVDGVRFDDASLSGVIGLGDVVVLLEGALHGNISETVNDLKNITKGLLRGYSETWIFNDLNELENALRLTPVRRVIVVMHDLDIPPTRDSAAALNALRTKVIAFKELADRTIQPPSHKFDFFCIVLLFKNIERFPFSSFPDDSELSFVHLLAFCPASDSNSSIEPDRASLAVLRAKLLNWGVRGPTAGHEISSSTHFDRET